MRSQTVAGEQLERRPGVYGSSVEEVALSGVVAAEDRLGVRLEPRRGSWCSAFQSSQHASSAALKSGDPRVELVDVRHATLVARQPRRRGWDQVLAL